MVNGLMQMRFEADSYNLWLGQNFGYVFPIGESVIGHVPSPSSIWGTTMTFFDYLNRSGSIFGKTGSNPGYGDYWSRRTQNSAEPVKEHKHAESTLPKEYVDLAKKICKATSCRDGNGMEQERLIKNELEKGNILEVIQAYDDIHRDDEDEPCFIGILVEYATAGQISHVADLLKERAGDGFITDNDIKAVTDLTEKSKTAELNSDEKDKLGDALYQLYNKAKFKADLDKDLTDRKVDSSSVDLTKLNNVFKTEPKDEKLTFKVTYEKKDYEAESYTELIAAIRKDHEDFKPEDLPEIKKTS